MRTAVALVALLAASASAISAEEQRALARGLSAGSLEPTEETYAWYPLAEEEISAAATGSNAHSSLVGATALDVHPLTLDSEEEGAVHTSGVLNAVRALEGTLIDQQRALDEVFSSSQQRCKDDATALGEQVALLRKAIEQKESHLDRTRVLIDQPRQFIEANKRVLHNLEREHAQARAALSEQERLAASQAEGINTALASAEEALQVLRSAHAHRQQLWVNPRAEAPALLQLAEAAALTRMERSSLKRITKALSRAGKSDDASAPAPAAAGTAVEAGLQLEAEVSKLTEESKETHAHLATEEAELEHAHALEAAAKKHAEEVHARAEALAKDVERIVGELSALSAFTGEADAGAVEQARTAAKLAEEQAARADTEVSHAHSLVVEAKENVEGAWKAVHIVEESLQATTERRAAVISGSNALVQELEVALGAVVARLQSQSEQVQAQLARARARFATINSRIKHEAPALRAAIRQLDAAREQERDQVRAIEVRKAELEQQLEHVKHSFARLAAHCEHDAAEYARQTEARTRQRASLRVLSQHLEVKLSAVQRSIAAAHAAHEVRQAHEELQQELLLAALRGDAELRAVSLEGASDVVLQGEAMATGLQGLDGVAGAESMLSRAAREVSEGHAATESRVRELVRLAEADKVSIHDAAWNALRAAQQMVDVLRNDVDLKKAHAQALATDVVRARQARVEAQEHERVTAQVYESAKEYFATIKNQTDRALEATRALVQVSVDETLEEMATDRVVGTVTLPTELGEEGRAKAVDELIHAALDMPAFPESDVAPPAAALLLLEVARTRSALRARVAQNTPFEAAIIELRPLWSNFTAVRARLDSVREQAEKAAYAARVAEAHYEAVLRGARDAAAVAEDTRAQLERNLALWERLAEYARHVLGIAMPKVSEEVPAVKCGNDSVTCTARHLDGEAARRMLDDLRTRHALLLREQKALREVEHSVAVARATNVAKYAGEEEASALQGAADNAVLKTQEELSAVTEQVDKVTDYLADVDAEELMRRLQDGGIGALSADSVVQATAAVAAVSGDVSHSTEKTVQELDARLPPANALAHANELAAREASLATKREELEHAREDLREQREASTAARQAAEEARAAGEVAAQKAAEELLQESEEAARDAEARVAKLEGEFSTLEVQAHQAKEELEQSRVEEEIAAAEEIAAVVPEETPTLLPSVNTLSKVEIEEAEARRITNLADQEAGTYRQSLAQA